MEIKVTPKPKTSQVELDITVPAIDFAPYIDKAAQKLSQDHPLDGFRPGKAPTDKVIAAFGQEKVLREAMDQALPKFFVKALVDEDIPVVSRPNITIQNLGLDQDFQFIATAHVVPEVKIGDPKQIRVTKKIVTVTDDEVKHELNYLAKMRGQQIEVTRPAQMKDTVIVDFHVTVGGRVVEGGQSSNHPVHLGEGHFIPDFESQLVGVTAGQTKQFTVNFPADFPREEYRGQTAQVWVKVHSVAQRLVPEVNDDFAKSLGKFKDLAHLKSELKTGITKDKERKEKDRLHSAISQKLVEISNFNTFPDVLIDREIDRQLEEFTQMLALQQRTLESYMFDEQKTIQEIRAEMKPQALTNLKTSLALRAFADQEKIEVSEEDIKKKAAKYLEQFSHAKQAGEKIDPDDLRTNIASMLRSQQALKRLAKEVTIEEEPAQNPTKQIDKK